MDKTLISIEEITSRVKELIKNNEGPFSVVTCDIDNLNNINKIHGNDIGDEVINKVISIFANNLSDTDLINRSGDEFTLLLVKKGAERSFMDLEEIRRYLSDNTFDLKNLTKTENINITLSFGVASYPRDSKNVIDLLRVADSGLFRAKKEGRNRICLSEAESMVLKSSYFTKTQLDRLSELSKANDKTEAFLLREALDGLFKKYNK
ncbi:GGDEF domain-containing protein [Clostridium frigoris]|uniref:GGDEF domain-containing protein n=1 Tax=Clostridium frigoris TaxID=205327 RepID=A0ABS6BN91_9CLOT|nr:GGDEF domain-containing protein [Clostridium frigoris]MBU3158389.1 GGDEF domain-containing protein [Clostridium frigoris]